MPQAKCSLCCKLTENKNRTEVKILKIITFKIISDENLFANISPTIELKISNQTQSKRAGKWEKEIVNRKVIFPRTL